MHKLLRLVKYYVDEYTLNICEKINYADVKRAISDYSIIISSVTHDNYKRNLMKAIIFEEQVHQYPLQTFVENNISIKLVKFFDIADSVGLAQIRVSLWADKYQTNRQELINSETHILIMSRHIDYIFSYMKTADIPCTPEWVGTLWHNMNATCVSAYGQRVLGFYNTICMHNLCHKENIK